MSDCSKQKKTLILINKQTKKKKKTKTLNYNMEEEKNSFNVYKLHGR